MVPSSQHRHAQQLTHHRPTPANSIKRHQVADATGCHNAQVRVRRSSSSACAWCSNGTDQHRVCGLGSLGREHSPPGEPKQWTMATSTHQGDCLLRWAVWGRGPGCWHPCQSNTQPAQFSAQRGRIGRRFSDDMTSAQPADMRGDRCQAGVTQSRDHGSGAATVRGGPWQQLHGRHHHRLPCVGPPVPACSEARVP